MPQDPRETRRPLTELAVRKARIRGNSLAARDALPTDKRTRLSAAICARAAALPEIAQAQTVMLFASFGSEVDTARLIDQVLSDGRALCLPRVLKPRSMAAYRVTDPPAGLALGTWGIPEPRQGLIDVAPTDIDVVIVPGSVFDTEGRRCGYGGGFYDTYLPRTRPGVPRIALAFEAQMVARLPCEPHDLKMDAIVTETRVIRPD